MSRSALQRQMRNHLRESGGPADNDPLNFLDTLTEELDAEEPSSDSLVL